MLQIAKVPIFDYLSWLFHTTAWLKISTIITGWNILMYIFNWSQQASIIKRECWSCHVSYTSALPMGFPAWLSPAQTEWNEAFLAISKSALALINASGHYANVLRCFYDYTANVTSSVMSHVTMTSLAMWHHSWRQRQCFIELPSWFGHKNHSFLVMETNALRFCPDLFPTFLPSLVAIRPQTAEEMWNRQTDRRKNSNYSMIQRHNFCSFSRLLLFMVRKFSDQLKLVLPRFSPDSITEFLPITSEFTQISLNTYRFVLQQERYCVLPGPWCLSVFVYFR